MLWLKKMNKPFKVLIVILLSIVLINVVYAVGGECYDDSDCDDGRICTLDICSPTGYCSHSNDDGLVCSGTCKECKNGYCTFDNPLNCADNKCKEPTCTSGVCGQTNVASGATDEACTGNTGCTGGNCVCNGAGSCISCNECSPSGSRQCSGSSYQICGNYDSDSCLEWGALISCNDYNVCTNDACSSGSCTYTNNNGVSCTSGGSSGTCCGGNCDTTTVNSDFAAACRSGPSCVSGVWKYSVANDGGVCSGVCRECSGGYCTVDDNANCPPSTPFCVSGTCVACTTASQCDDGNACTTDACSSGVCSHSNVANGASCTGGTCCSGVCDTSVGNSGFSVDCRSGPSCVGSSWEYSVANTGALCGGFACRECSSGYCTADDNSNCPAGYTCSVGTCVAGCTNDCPSSGSRTCFGSSYMVCGNFDTDSCLEWGTPVACPDNVCREPSCSGGACGETFVGSGLTDEACTGIIGCVSVDGGSCVCNGAGSCVSQPAVCIHECSPSGAKQCSGNSVQTCGNYDLDSCFEWGNTVACSGSTPYCSGGVCVQCTQASDCNDNNECTSDSCSSNVCSNSRVANGTSCTGGSCCSGSCDTTVGNSDFYVNCRNGPGCVGTSWQYNIANNGSVCSGTCTQCANGFCNFNNNSRCSSGQVCLSGTCSSTGCTSDSQCSGSTPYCNTANGQCVVCLLASHCSDNNPCTIDSCVSNVCTSTNAADNTSCTSCSGTSCKCQTGVCSCVPDCAGKQCGSNGCGGSCGNCLSYIGGNVCYDEGNCTNGICSYATNTLAPSANCCDHALVIQSSNCIQENIPNSSKCPAGQFCSSDCQCESNPCDSSLTEVSCNSMADCEWCPLISGCLPKDYVQCTDNAVCYTGNQVCKSNCRLSSCTGTNASCGCSLGECTICKADEACTNNYCISALLPMCIPNWVCGDWSVCNAFGEQARICTDYNACGSLENKPLTIMSCTYAAAETGVNTEFDSGTEETETSEKEPETESPSTIEPTERGNKGFPWVIGVIVFILVIGGVGALIYIKRGGDFSWLEERFSWLESIRPHSTQPKTVSLTSNQERTLFEYVHGCLASNYTPNQIREGLIRSGWPKQVVDEILRKII